MYLPVPRPPRIPQPDGHTPRRSDVCVLRVCDDVDAVADCATAGFLAEFGGLSDDWVCVFEARGRREVVFDGV